MTVTGSAAPSQGRIGLKGEGQRLGLHSAWRRVPTSTWRWSLGPSAGPDLFSATPQPFHTNARWLAIRILYLCFQKEASVYTRFRCERDGHRATANVGFGHSAST